MPQTELMKSMLAFSRMLEVTSKEEIVPWIVQEKEEAAFFFSEIKKKDGDLKGVLQNITSCR